MSVTIQEKAQKRAYLIQEFKNVIEKKNILSDVATKIVAKAKNIISPFTSVTDAKAHQLPGRVPVGTLTHGIDELVLDRKIGNAIKEYEEEISYAKFNLTDNIRADVYATVIEKNNKLAVSDIIASATDVTATPEDLSTAEKVRKFLLGVRAAHERVVSVRKKVDGASTKKAKYHGKAFVACGSDAFVQITSQILGITAQSTLKGVDGNVIETPYGVAIIDLGEAATNANTLIYGTAGVPVLGYREDKVKVDMGEIQSSVTAPSNSIDVTAGDEMIETVWFFSAETKGKNGVFSNNAALVKSGLMATA